MTFHAEPLAGRFDAEPLGLVRSGDVGLLADALGADHDVGQLEVDVGEAAEQARVEARRALVSFPAVAGLDELVDAVSGQRREQPREVALVLGDRVALPELADRVVLLRRRLALQELAHVLTHGRDSTASG